MHSIDRYSPSSSMLTDEVAQDTQSDNSGQLTGAVHSTAMATISGYAAGVCPSPLLPRAAEAVKASLFKVPADQFIKIVKHKEFGELPDVGPDLFFITKCEQKKIEVGAFGLFNNYAIAFRGKNLETKETTLCLYYCEFGSYEDIIIPINELKDEMVKRTKCNKDTIEVFIVGGKDSVDLDLIRELADNPENKIKCLLNPTLPDHVLDVVLTENRLYVADGEAHLFIPSNLYDSSDSSGEDDIGEPLKRKGRNFSEDDYFEKFDAKRLKRDNDAKDNSESTDLLIQSFSDLLLRNKTSRE